MHRVGLTRHCLTSGRVQLPFALSGAFPEGDLLAHDVDHDEVLLLESLPPRRLSGLREYFERNELQVNDLLEFRLAAGELRLACVRRARRAPGEAREARASAVPGDARPATDAAEPSDARAAASDVDRVIGRIGSVTVRRLGSGRFAPPPEAALRTTRPAVRAVREADAEGEREARDPAAPDVAPASAADAGEALGAPADAAGEGREAPAGTHGRTMGARPADARTTQAAGTPASGGDAAAHDPSDDLDALLDTAPAARPEAERDRVGEGDLLDAGEVRARDRAGRPGPVLRWLRRPAGGDERLQPRPRRTEAHGAPQPAEAAGPRAEASASRPRRATPAPSDGPASSSGGADAPAADPAERQRAREEALSRAGDLRSRIVRWLLDPGTPVIVQHEHVQRRFGLDAGVARDVLDGILDDPPPSLRLTAVREDMLRISRVTVQQEG